MSAICVNARMLLPSTLPASCARSGMVDMSSSTTRVCFSSTTLWAMICPNVSAEMKNTRPNAIATM